MTLQSRVIEVPKAFKTVIELLKDAILNQHLEKHYYESDKGNKGFRIIRPYI